ISWKRIHTPICFGGLGLLGIKCFRKAVIYKWFSRITVQGILRKEMLQKRLLEVKDLTLDEEMGKEPYKVIEASQKIGNFWKLNGCVNK
ncbi:Hypothetical protein FKW44_003853, partial [Caligus rogercresseyi]